MSQERPLVIDTFMYNGEPILHFRIRHLYPVVDRFVIAESIETHSGQAKDGYFIDADIHKEMLEPYKDKLTIVRIPSLSDLISQTPHYNKEGNKHWEREGLQRDMALAAIKEFAGDRRYILSVCDADEIPRAEVFADPERLYGGTDTPLYLEMRFFYYNFAFTRQELWYHAFLKNDRNIDTTSLTHARQNIRSNQMIANAGWHLSYFSSINEITRKLEQFAHTEFNRDEFKQAEHIRRAITEGHDLFSRHYEKIVRNTDFDTLPAGWQNLQLWLKYNQYLQER